jgi:hypothetical protein
MDHGVWSTELSPTIAASFCNFSNLAFMSVHLYASKRMSSAKCRTSNLSIIFHCSLFLPLMTLFMNLSNTKRNRVRDNI